MRRAFRPAGMGLSGLLGNPFRSLLAMLGMVIGVAAIVVLTSLGKGVEEEITGEIKDLGTNIVRVDPGSEDAGGPFGVAAASTLTPRDVRRVEGLPSVRAASANSSLAAPIRGKNYPFSGVDPSYAEIRSVELSAGRFIGGRGEIVLAPAAAERLFGPTSREAVGELLSIAGKDYRVVGVARKVEASPGLDLPASDTSYMQTGDALGLSGSGTVGRIVVRAEGAGAVEEAAEEIRNELKAAHGGKEDFSVTTQEELLSTFSRVADLLTYLLAGIAGISLLIGGIGIMNVMLVSVAERTREIGVRKAIGATHADVLLQFLFEAVLLASIGGLAGLGLGVGVSALLPTFSENLPTTVVWNAAWLVVGVSALTGVFFGVLPAYRSARLQPVEALRRE